MPTNRRPFRLFRQLKSRASRAASQQRRACHVESFESRIMFHLEVQSAIPDQVGNSSGSTTIDLSPRIFNEEAGPTVRVATTQGNIDILLLERQAPLSVANFMTYVNQNKYDNTVIHRAPQDFVVQMGGYTPTFTDITPPGTTPVQNEFSATRSNVRGTIAYAKVGPQGNNPPTPETINSATSEFFVNLSDSNNFLDSQNGGFTVFGRVDASGMTVADAIDALPKTTVTVPTGSFADVPLRQNPPSTTPPSASDLVLVNDVFVVSEAPAVTYTVTSSNPGLVNPAIVSGRNLVLNYGSGIGTATVTVTATEAGSGSTISDTFDVTVGSVDVNMGQGANAQTVIFTDADSTQATVRVTGGTATLKFGGNNLTQTTTGTTVTVAGDNVQILQMVLSGTYPNVTITTNALGDGKVEISEGITSDSAVKGVVGKGVILGGTTTLNNGIGRLQVARTQDATIDINRGSAARLLDAMVTIGTAEDTAIDSQQPLRLLKVDSWTNADATADTITTTRINGIRSTGDFNANLSLSGNGQAVGAPVLGNARIGGVLGATTWDVTGRTLSVMAGSINGWTANLGTLNKLTSQGAITGATVRTTGDIGAVTAGSIVNSTIFAGVTGDPLVLPTTAGAFPTPSTIRGVTIRNRTTDPAFAGSTIAASAIGRAVLGVVNVSNAGTPFGLAAQSIGSLSATAGATPIRAARLTEPSQSIASTDFEVRVF
jgi:cyclophilin family peptidyl-prolyl cis-trans isomerase